MSYEVVKFDTARKLEGIVTLVPITIVTLVPITTVTKALTVNKEAIIEAVTLTKASTLTKKATVTNDAIIEVTIVEGAIPVNIAEFIVTEDTTKDADTY